MLTIISLIYRVNIVVMLENYTTLSIICKGLFKRLAVKIAGFIAIGNFFTSLNEALPYYIQIHHTPYALLL